MSAAMAEGYMDDSVIRLEPRLVRIESGVANVNERVGRIEQRVEHLGERVGLIERRLVAVEVNTENIKENLGKLHIDMRDMRGEIRGLMRFMIGIVITFFTTLIGFGAGLLVVLAKGLHWLQ